MEYLGIADFDYLSARLLLLSGLATTGFPLAAQAIEKLLKLFMLLYEKIVNNRELTVKEMQGYSHNLVSLFNYLKERVKEQFDSSWENYFQALQDSYYRRYPEGWKIHKYEVEAVKLDMVYCHLRNRIITNFPNEEINAAKKFGTFVINAYTKEIKNIIKNRNGILPREIFYLNNESAANFDINFD